MTHALLLPTALLMLAALAISAQHASAQLGEKKVLTLAAAQKMVAAAQAEAERNHLAGVIAVVDDGGWPILLGADGQRSLYCECRARAGQGPNRGVVQEAE